MTTSIIAPGILTQLQVLSLRTFPDTAQIVRDTKVDDGRGGQTDSWNVSSTVPCRLEPFMGRKGGDEEQRGDLFITAGYWRITLPSGTDITSKDRVTVTTKANRTFEVKAVDGPKSYEVVLRAFCVEMT